MLNSVYVCEKDSVRKWESMPIGSKPMVNLINEVTKGIRVPKMAPTICCHPYVASKLYAELEKRRPAEQTIGIYHPFATKIVESDLFPATKQFPIVKYHDSRFITYSSGPSDPKMTQKEYEDMCVLLGWAHIEYEERYVVFLMNGEQVTFDNLPSNL